MIAAITHTLEPSRDFAALLGMIILIAVCAVVWIVRRSNH